MKPVNQEFLHKPEIGQHGDCQRAVIASLLELPLSEVPHFLQVADGDPTLYWEGLQVFCRSHGYAFLTVPARSGSVLYGDDGPVYHEISGPSPRGNGVYHAVVGCNGVVVFDPHPSRAGLAGDPVEWQHAYLVATSAGERAAPAGAQPHQLTDDQILEAVEKALGLKRRRDSTVIDSATGRFTDAARYLHLGRLIEALTKAPQ